ncbi:MAG: hypothetical protein EBU93_06560 [Chlamydiae bacterium]|nr:hypothetical protein [Chlamydiota bacterium]
MILDKYLSFDNKVLFSIVCAGLWIYFRTEECYSMIPRLHGFPVAFVMIWAYWNYYEPLFLPLGLAVLILYSLLLNDPHGPFSAPSIEHKRQW